MSFRDRFKIFSAQLEDRDRIEVFIRKHFYKYEPMNMSLGITEGHRCTDKILPLKFLHLGLSLIAAITTDDGQEQIVGVCLNGEDTTEDEFQFTFPNECEKLKKFNTCVMKVHREADIFQGSSARKALDMYLLAVDPDYKRKGIGKALIDHSISIVAREKGYSLVTVLCTSFYTAKIAEALNMKLVYVLRYDEYLDADGMPVFKPPKPHEAIRVFTLLI